MPQRWSATYRCSSADKTPSDMSYELTNSPTDRIPNSSGDLRRCFPDQCDVLVARLTVARQWNGVPNPRLVKPCRPSKLRKRLRLR